MCDRFNWHGELFNHHGAASGVFVRHTTRLVPTLAILNDISENRSNERFAPAHFIQSFQTFGSGGNNFSPSNIATYIGLLKIIPKSQLLGAVYLGASSRRDGPQPLFIHVQGVLAKPGIFPTKSLQGDGATSSRPIE